MRDTAGPTNYCAKKYGVVRVEGGLPERPCRLEAKALTALVSARLALKKTNPNLELLVVSTYRAPAYQQCLWLDEGPKGPKCLSSLCGPRDAKGKPLSCKKYDLEDPKLAHVFDHCAHVDMRAVDICAYDRTKVTLDAHGVLDMTMVEDCRDSIEPKKKLGAGRFFHPCGCRHTTWTKDFRKATARTDVFTHGGVDEQQAMFAALRSAGFKDNVSTEWWHFHLPADLSANLPANP